MVLQSINGVSKAYLASGLGTGVLFSRNNKLPWLYLGPTTSTGGSLAIDLKLFTYFLVCLESRGWLIHDPIENERLGISLRNSLKIISR